VLRCGAAFDSILDVFDACAPLVFVVVLLVISASFVKLALLRVEIAFLVNHRFAKYRDSN